jgi:hypothetical protein
MSEVVSGEPMVILRDQTAKVAERLDSLTGELRGAETPHQALAVVGRLKVELETFAFALPGPVATCELDGSAVYEAQGENGPYRYCAYGHRWP